MKYLLKTALSLSIMKIYENWQLKCLKFLEV